MQVAHPHLILRRVIGKVFTIRLVGVVTGTAFGCPIADHPSRSSTWPVVGRTSTTGSSTPVGRITCSATSPPLTSISQYRVAETKTVWRAFSRTRHPSTADYRPHRQAKAVLDQHLLTGLVAVVHACSCERVTWLSSISSQSSGK